MCTWFKRNRAFPIRCNNFLSILNQLTADGSLFILRRLDRPAASDAEKEKDWDFKAKEGGDPLAISLICILVGQVATLVNVSVLQGEGTEFACITAAIYSRDDDRGKKQAREAAIADESNDSRPEPESSKDAQDGIDSKEEQRAAIERVDY